MGGTRGWQAGGHVAGRRAKGCADAAAVQAALASSHSHCQLQSGECQQANSPYTAAAHPSVWPPPRRAPPRPAGAGGAAALPRARAPPQTAGSGRAAGPPAAGELPGAAGRPQPCCRRARAPFSGVGASGALPAAATTCAVLARCCKQVQQPAFCRPTHPSSPCSA